MTRLVWAAIAFALLAGLVSALTATGDPDPLTRFVRLTARLSALWFALGFALEPFGPVRAWALLQGFVATHLIHLAAVAAWYGMEIEPLVLSPVVALLGIGVAALPLVALRAAPSLGILTPVWAHLSALYFLWFLFFATYATRLLEAELRAPAAIYTAWLALIAGALAVRLCGVLRGRGLRA